MHRIAVALAVFYRRWKFVEDQNTASAPAGRPTSTQSEPLRIYRAIEREKLRLEDYRQNGCAALARGCESRLRYLQNHLAAMKF
jgi:hypothetical protein